MEGVADGFFLNEKKSIRDEKFSIAVEMNTKVIRENGRAATEM